MPGRLLGSSKCIKQPEDPPHQGRLEIALQGDAPRGCASESPGGLVATQATPRPVCDSGKSGVGPGALHFSRVHEQSRGYRSGKPHGKPGFLTRHTMVGQVILEEGPVLGSLGCLAVSLASTPLITPPPRSLLPSCDNHKCLQTWPNVPWGQNHAWLRTAGLKSASNHLHP